MPAGNKWKDADARRKTFEEARKVAQTPPERTIVDRAEHLADDFTKVAAIYTPGSYKDKDKIKAENEAARMLLAAVFPAYAVLLRDAATLLPDDVRVQSLTVAWMYNARSYATSAGVDEETRDAALRREALDTIEGLLKRFPRDAELWATRAEMCDGEHEDDLSCVRIYAKCVALDSAPEHTKCREFYRGALRAYTAPRCAADALRPRLGLFLATRESRPGTRKLAGQNPPLYVDLKPSFSEADMKGARTLVRKETVVENGGRKESEVTYSVLSVRANRERALTAWGATFPEQGSHIVVRQEDEELLVGSVRPGKGTWDSITLDVPLTRVCKTVESRSLPPDLPSP